MKSVRAICLDLDDTLWDLRPVIPRAERALYDWYREHYPQVAETFSPAEIRELRNRVALDNPHLAHDLTYLRMMVLRQVAEASGYEASMAEEAFGVFDAERNAVELFPDVLPALQRLSRQYRLLTLSNGNANLEKMGIAHHFARSYSARELGVAKPDAAIFIAVCEREELRPEEILHVGDHPENDVVAARAMGMPVVWINRHDHDWSLGHEQPPQSVSCLEGLAALLGA